jgi:serine/threonine protein kinase
MQSLNDLKPGKFLGRYELLMPVAQGGMAAVWAARLVGTRGFQRVVAIKTILPTLSDDASFEQMFLDEAALAARIRHPNVVQVLDLGEDNGLLYQVMEWIDGEALSSFLRDPKAVDGLPHAIASRIMIGVCDGLHAAHETRDDADQVVGLVHRDVSPQNILVTRDGVPKVVDFGVAKASSLSSARTTAGTLKGKPAYMAPEQIQGGEVDRRADIFSLGVLLYMATTGHNPFRGANDMATLHNICSSDEAPRPSTFSKSYPEELEEVVMRAIAKDRLRRFPTAAAMARAIEQAVPEVRKTGDSEVAEFVRAFLSKRLEARSSALRQALIEADQRASIPGSPQSTLRGLGQGATQRAAAPDRPSSTAVGGFAPVPAEPTDVPTVSVETLNPTLARPPRPAPSGRRTGAAIGLGIAVVLGMIVTAGAVFWFVRNRRPAEPTPASSATVVDATPPPTASVVAEAASPAEPPITPDTLPTASDTAVAVPPRDPGGREPQPSGSDTLAAPPASTPPAASSAGPGRIRGTVPSIRDPGF